MAKKPEPTYEELSSELDTIMSDLQRDDVNVDQAVKHYERGLELITLLQAQLTSAENTVQALKAKFDAS